MAAAALAAATAAAAVVVAVVVFVVVVGVGLEVQKGRIQEEISRQPRYHIPSYSCSGD